MSDQMVGVINVLKPPGPTSHDVVARVRRILGFRKIGHGGTLDPGAAGVLPILLGRATKLMPFILDHPKEYRAELTLGIATDTQDAFGETIRVETGFSIKPAALADVLFSFIGEIEQIPPMTSAVKSGGRRLYELARRGEIVEREPRPVRIYEIHVRAVWPGDAAALTAGSRVLIDVTCSRGTYIRTLCHDIGVRLGCGAHMSFLVRTAVGPFTLSESVALEELEEAVGAGHLEQVLLPPQAALSHLPRVDVDKRDAVRLRQGQAVPAPSPEALSPFSLVHVMEAGERIVCVGRIEQTGEQCIVKPVRVL